MARLPYFKQETLYTCGAAASRMVLSKRGVKLSEKAISKFLGVTPRKGTTLVMIKRLFDRYNFDAWYHYKIRDKKSAFAGLGDICVMVLSSSHLWTGSSTTGKPRESM